MKLVETKGKAPVQEITPGKKHKKAELKVIRLGEGHSACFGLGRETCRQTTCCLRTFCLAGWQVFVGLERS